MYEEEIHFGKLF